MIGKILKVLGDSNERQVKRYQGMVTGSTRSKRRWPPLSDDELAEMTVEFRERLAESETLDDLMPEAFAVVREAARRTIGMRHFDVQLIGGAVLHQGNVAEMKTGEGKTLVATLAAYLNALEGGGVHVNALEGGGVPLTRWKAAASRCDGERLPGSPGRSVDGQGLHVPRIVRRLLAELSRAGERRLLHAGTGAPGGGQRARGHARHLCAQRSVRGGHHLRGRTTSSVSITCVTTWRESRRGKFSEI